MAAREDAGAKTGQEPQVPVFTVLKNNVIFKNIFLINNSSSSVDDDALREDSSKNRQDLEQKFVVGRHPDCDIRLEHPSISRFHLRIHSKPSAKRLSVTDLSSAHGTWISGKRIQPKNRVDVNEGDALRIGASSRVYRLHWVPLQKAYSSKPFIPRLDLPSLDEEKEEEEMRLDENALELENGAKTADPVAVASKDVNSLLLKREGDEGPLVSGCECFVDSAFEAIRALVCNQFETNAVQDEDAIIACSMEDGNALESSCSEASMQSALNPNFKPLENLEVLSVAPQPEAMGAFEMQPCLVMGNEALFAKKDHCSDDAILEHEEGSTMLNLEDDSNFAGDIEEVHVSGSSPGSMQLALNFNFGPLEDLEVLSVAPQPEAMKAVETQLCLDRGNDADLEHEEDPMMLNLEDNSIFSEDMEGQEEEEEVQDSGSSVVPIGELEVDASKGTGHEHTSHDAVLEHVEGPMMLNLEDNSIFSEAMEEGQQKDEEVQDSGSSIVSIGDLEFDTSKGTGYEHTSHDAVMVNSESSNFSEEMEEDQEEEEEVQDSGSSIVSIGEHELTSFVEWVYSPLPTESISMETENLYFEEENQSLEVDHFLQESSPIGGLEVDPPEGNEHEPTSFAEWIDSPLPIVSIDVETENLYCEEESQRLEVDPFLQGSSPIGELEIDPPIEPISVETENLYFEEENQSLAVDLFSQEPSPVKEISGNEHLVQLCNDSEQDDSWSFWSLSQQTATLESQSVSIDEENQGSEGEHTKKEGKSSEDPTSLWSFWSMMEGKSSPSPDSESLSQVELQSPNQSPRTRKLFTDKDILEEDCFTPVKRQSSARLSPLSSAAKSLSKSAKRANQRTPLQTLSCNSNKENQTSKVLKLHNSSMVKKGVMQRTPLRALSMESPQKSVSKNSMSGGANLSAVSNKENRTPKITRQEWKSARIPSPQPSNLFMPKREADAEKLPFQSLFLDSPEEKSARCSSPERMPLQTLFVDSPQKSLDFITSLNSENKKKGFVDQAKRWTMVVDITCLLNENSRRALQLLEGIKGTQLVVPEAVVKELDSMKQQQQPIIFRKSSDPFSASEWIEDCLIRTKWWIQVHSSSDSALEHALCLKKTQKDGRLVLLSDDFSTKIKAMEEGLVCESAAEFQKSLVNPFSSRFLWAGSSARGRTWSCFDDVILRRNFYPDYMVKGVENARGLKLALL